MNGPYLPDDFWQRLDERFNRLYDLHDELKQEFAHLNSHGCAQRGNDIRRIENLERWRDRGIIGLVALAIGVISNFFGIRS